MMLGGAAAAGSAAPQTVPPPPDEAPPPSARDAVDEVAAAFAHYNRNGDGMLDLPEIQVLLEDANFAVDASYVNGVADMFGTWDADGSGGIELPEASTQAILWLLVIYRCSLTDCLSL